MSSREVTSLKHYMEFKSEALAPESATCWAVCAAVPGQGFEKEQWRFKMLRQKSIGGIMSSTSPLIGCGVFLPSSVCPQVTGLNLSLIDFQLKLCWETLLLNLEVMMLDYM